jgi:hypothetical protein
MAFQYDDLRLDRPHDQIRVLHLQQGSDDADIQIELRVYDCNDCPPYVAISYTWGDLVPTFPIIVNGQSFRVRMNCFYALWQMRHHNQHSNFWLDSICINQHDLEEKNVQVAQMGKIYENAVMTASCLGPGYGLAAAKKIALSAKENVTSDTLLPERNAFKGFQQNGKPTKRRSSLYR